MTIYRGTGSSQSGVGVTLDEAYVNVSGDTMTGHLNVPAGGTGFNVPTRQDVDTAISTSVSSGVSAHTSDTTDAHAGSAITNTPTGDIAATTVQAAINELDADKVPRTSTTGSAVLPSGTTVEGGTGASGYLRHDSTLDAITAWIGGAWATVVTTANAVLTTGNQTIAGVKTFSSPVGVAAATASGDAVRKDQLITNNLVGTTTNDSATAGNIGEVISSTVLAASGVANTSGVSVDVTSISLTAGDWDVSGMIWIIPTASTTYAGGGASVTSATLVAEYYALQAATSTAGVQVALAIPTYRVSIAATTTVYLVGTAAFASGTCKVAGTIRARRMR